MRNLAPTFPSKLRCADWLLGESQHAQSTRRHVRRLLDTQSFPFNQNNPDLVLVPRLGRRRQVPPLSYYRQMPFQPPLGNLGFAVFCCVLLSSYLLHTYHFVLRMPIAAVNNKSLASSLLSLTSGLELALR